MAISENTEGNHDQLFAGRASTLAQSDPELIEYFDTFAFDETLTDAAALDESPGRADPAAGAAGCDPPAAGGLGEFRALAAAAIERGGVSPVELKEVVYQGVANAGMARAYDYLHAVNEIGKAT